MPSFPGWQSFTVVVLILVTAGIGIPLRCYLISAVAFDHRRLGEKFRQMFLFILVLDLLWAASPLLITHKIGFGAAFAVTAALLYVPFSERTLIAPGLSLPIQSLNFWNQAHRTYVSSSDRLRQYYVSIRSNSMRRMGLAVLTLVLLAGSAGPTNGRRLTTSAARLISRWKPPMPAITVDTWDQNTIEAHVTTKNYKIGQGGITIEDKQVGDAVAIDTQISPRIFQFFHPRKPPRGDQLFTCRNRAR